MKRTIAFSIFCCFISCQSVDDVSRIEPSQYLEEYINEYFMTHGLFDFKAIDVYRQFEGYLLENSILSDTTQEAYRICITQYSAGPTLVNVNLIFEKLPATEFILYPSNAGWINESFEKLAVNHQQYKNMSNDINALSKLLNENPTWDITNEGAIELYFEKLNSNEFRKNLVFRVPLLSRLLGIFSYNYNSIVNKEIDRIKKIESVGG